MHAALSSAIAFLAGAILPMLAILLTPSGLRVPVAVLVALVALAATGALGARLGQGAVGRATLRVVIGGALALATTYLVGTLLGTASIA